MYAQCEFSFYFCGADGQFRKDLGFFYCDRHAEAVRSLAEEPPLARVDVVGGKRTRSPFGLIEVEETEIAIELIREEYPDAVEVCSSGFGASIIIWLRPGHKFLELCAEELGIGKVPN